MEVKYNRPTTNAKGVYVFHAPIEQMGDDHSVRVSSLEDYLEIQTRILKVTEGVIDYLRCRELPAGVEGNAEVMFRLWNANRHIFGLGNIGKLGFPEVSIQTNYGLSNFFLWPHEEGGEVELRGRGLAEEVVRVLKGDFQNAFGVKDSLLQTYHDTSMNPLYLSGRLILPKPLV